MRRIPHESYSPLYFLASLGFGGTAVSFFMYFMFLVPHPDTPMPTFEDVFPRLMDGGLSALWMVIPLLGMVVFAVMHFYFLVWNIQKYMAFKQTTSYAKLLQSSNHVALMAIPLTLSMSINVLFVLGAIFVPGLWGQIEYLLPLATIAFALVGWYAIRIFNNYFSRFIVNGDFDFVNMNSLSHMISIFAFSMIAVGFAAPAGMSHALGTSVISLLLSIFFASIAASLAIVKITIGLRAIFKHGIAKEAGPTLWIMIPVLTMFGVAFVRLYAGVSHNFYHVQPSPYLTLLVLATLFSLQILFGAVGYRVMQQLDYFKIYVSGPERSPGSFTLICPGIAFFVQGMFLLGWGMVKTNIVPLFSPIYFLLLIPLVYIQLKTIRVLFQLVYKHFWQTERKAAIVESAS